jgi:hypothetical protein
VAGEGEQNAVRQTFVALGLLMSCGSLQAQPASVPAAIAALKSVIKDPVTWSAANAQRADVTCDGKPDVILFGAGPKTAGKETVWVGVVPGGGKPLAMEFPVSSSVSNGFCRPPKKISISPISCSTAALGRLDGCQDSTTCKEFAVEDGTCEPFHFYWDSRLKGIRTWRN